MFRFYQLYSNIFDKESFTLKSLAAKSILIGITEWNETRRHVISMSEQRLRQKSNLSQHFDILKENVTTLLQS